MILKKECEFVKTSLFSLTRSSRQRGIEPEQTHPATFDLREVKRIQLQST